MKKLLLVFPLFASSLLSHAQLQRGGWMLGTNLGSTGITRGDGFSSGRTINASLTPQVGRFVTDRLVVGAGIGLNYSSLKNVHIQPSNFSSVSVSVQPFARYYFTGRKNTDLVGRLVPFVEGGLGAMAFKNWYEVGASERYTSPWGIGFNAYFSPGVSYFFSPNVAAEARVVGSYANGPDISGSTSLSFELGFKVFLRGKGARTSTPAADR